MARQRPQPLRDHAAVRAHQHARAARGRGDAVAGVTRHVYVHTPRLREHRRDRLGEGAVPRPGRLPRRLRPLPAARPPRDATRHGVHLTDAELRRAATRPARRSRTARPRTSSSAAACSRSAQAKDAKRPMHVGLGTDIGARHELLAARHDERGLQGGRAAPDTDDAP